MANNIAIRFDMAGEKDEDECQTETSIHQPNGFKIILCEKIRARNVGKIF